MKKKDKRKINSMTPDSAAGRKRVSFPCCCWRSDIGNLLTFLGHKSSRRQRRMGKEKKKNFFCSMHPTCPKKDTPPPKAAEGYSQRNEFQTRVVVVVGNPTKQTLTYYHLSL